ncbi:D-alanine--poly(phosphoribitol) ligase subunit DltA [Kurthia sibirica]|uniref:D-alanine--poly(phosphoribitol) ligase subunit DltA n=2 Tax=Kurthia sibirica TaxID=202750 RepID=UPI00116E1722|nr:D-alanine--poly(phosphoribitol) ligase subunit DltA [Kurthia sibirica]GEK33751.1 D-alanine--poly(phosphoribitol) ligase subunit 1 [Kurthia sibirica]
MNMLQQIATIAAASPEKIAYRSEGEVISYGDLWQQSNEVAAAIRASNLKKNSPIAIYGHMSPQQIVAFLGATKAGHPYIPLDISIPNERVLHILEASKSSLLLSTEHLDLQVATPHHTVEEMRQKGEHAEDDTATWIEEDQVFYIIYTSGSTGKPKGVQISHANLSHFVDWLGEECSLPNGVFLNQAPYSFDLSVMDLYPALALGNELHALTKKQIEHAASLFEELQQSKIAVWTTTPSFAKICLMNPEWNEQMMPNLQTFLFCGEVLPNSVAKELLIRFPQAKVFNLYGPTETTVAVTAVEVTTELLTKYEQLPIAKASSSKLKVLNDTLQSVEDGQKGELVIFGDTVSSEGYLYATEQSEEVFKDFDGERIYKAGDLGYLKDGYIFYAGRSDFQVKLHGYRMEIEEIEKKIEALKEVASCAVLPIKKDEEVVSLTAMIVLHDELVDKPFKMTKHLKALLLQSIPSYMVPKKFTYLAAMPLNINGKIDRKRLAVETDL